MNQQFNIPDIKTIKGKIFLGIAIAIGLFVLIFAVRVVNEVNNKNASEPVVTETKPTAYDLRISRGLYGVKITSNETVDLNDCTVSLNNEYKSTEKLTKGIEEQITWGEFTKNAEKFDVDKLAIESVSVYDCNSDDRISSYDFPKS
jgi:hypothetical protein